MAEILVEAKNAKGWLQVGPAITALDQRGSITTDNDVYLFGWDEDGTPGVWRSISGAHKENNTRTRTVYTVGLELICDLTKHVHYTMTWRGAPLRFRLVP